MDNPATEPRLGSEQHDLVLAIALGALAAGQAFEQMTSATTDAEPLASDDPVVLASLGVVALDRTLRRWLDESASSPMAAAPQVPELIATLRELLR